MAIHSNQFIPLEEIHAMGLDWRLVSVDFHQEFPVVHQMGEPDAVVLEDCGMVRLVLEFVAPSKPPKKERG